MNLSEKQIEELFNTIMYSKDPIALFALKHLVILREKLLLVNQILGMDKTEEEMDAEDAEMTTVKSDLTGKTALEIFKTAFSSINPEKTPDSTNLHPIDAFGAMLDIPEDVIKIGRDMQEFKKSKPDMSFEEFDVEFRKRMNERGMDVPEKGERKTKEDIDVLLNNLLSKI